jgi:hypothetical protein
MDAIIEFLKFTIPGLIVFATSYFLIKAFFENEEKKRVAEYKSGNHKLITPVKLQAYERLVMFLERISPDSLLVRVMEPTMTVERLHSALLMTVRAEFEHNLSQQLYVSVKTWNTIRASKENVIRLINTVASTLDAKAPGFELSKRILDAIIVTEKSPVQTSIDLLKLEAEQFM